MREDDAAEDFAGKLLTLIVADDADLNLLLMTEILVIAHLARDEGIGSRRNGITQQERTRTTAERHLADRATQELVALHALHTETIPEQQHQVIGSDTLGKMLLHLIRKPASLGSLQDILVRDFSYYAAAAFHAIHFLLATKKLHVLQAQLLGNLEVHSACRCIHVGMHGDDGNIILDRLANGALHIVLIRYPGKLSEDERMMAYDEVAALLDRFIHHRLSDVKTQQCP